MATRRSRGRAASILVVLATASACSMVAGLDQFDGAELAIGSRPGDSGASVDSSVKPDGAVAEAGASDTGVRDSGAADAADAARIDSGGDGGPVVPGADLALDFATDIGGFHVNFGQPAILQTTSTLSLDSTTGNLGNGSMKVEIPFTAGDQKASVSVAFPATRDWRGKTLHARIKLTSGLRQTTPFGWAKLWVKSATATDANAFIYAENSPVDLDPAGGWIELTVTISTPKGYTELNYDPRFIREVGVEIDTPTAAAVTAAVVHIDDITTTQ